MRTLFFLCACFLLNNCFSQDFSIPDSIATVQSCNAFGSINDGQPSTPHFPFFQSVIQTNLDSEAEYNVCLGHTFGNKPFLRNSLFMLNLISGTFSPDFKLNKAVTTSWQQRWVYEQDKIPTISTLLQMSIPIDEIDATQEYDGIFMLVKNIGTTGVFYFNSFLNYSDSDFTFTQLLGHKQFLGEHDNLFVDLLYSFDKAPTLEVAYEYNFPTGSVISPGITYTYDSVSNEGSLVIGVSFLYQTF